jgi:hypothetical protein
MSDQSEEADVPHMTCWEVDFAVKSSKTGVNRALIFIKRKKIQTPKERNIELTRGGQREGAGRPKGAISLSTRAIIEAAKSNGEMPIDYMLRIMRDENAPDARRDRMARAAAAYMHSKLSTVEDEQEGDEGDATETVGTARDAP